MPCNKDRHAKNASTGGFLSFGKMGRDPVHNVTTNAMPEIPEKFFQTPRLLFRPFEERDLESLHAMHNDPEVYRYVGDSTPLSLADAKRWIRISRNNIAKFGFGSGAIILRATSDLIGWGGFARPDDQPPEIIYGFSRAHWSNGYASEFMEALISFSERLDEIRQAGALRATVDPQNAVSTHLLEKHGFSLKIKAYQGEVNCDLYTRPVD